VEVVFLSKNLEVFEQPHTKNFTKLIKILAPYKYAVFYHPKYKIEETMLHQIAKKIDESFCLLKE